MDGGFIHKLQIEEFLNECQKLDIPAFPQFRVFKDGKIFGYIDVLVEINNLRVAIEFDRSNQRIEKHVHKAIIEQVDELWFVAPNAKVRSQIQATLNKIESNLKLAAQEYPPIYLHTLPQQLERLRTYLSFRKKKEGVGVIKRCED